MRFRGDYSSGLTSNDEITEQQKKQRVSARLVILLAIVVLLTLTLFPEWIEKTAVSPHPTVLTATPEISKPNGEGSETGVQEKKPLLPSIQPTTKVKYKSSSTPTITSLNEDDYGQDVASSNNKRGIDGEENEEKLMRSSPATVFSIMKARTRPICPRSSNHAILLFPHVNKAGGRTIEGTFDSVLHPRSQFAPLSRDRRSTKFKFTLIDRHRDYDEIQEFANSFELKGQCVRWIFMLRDPVARTISAFNTLVGRKEIPQYRILLDHFYCESDKIKTLMKNPNFTLDDFADLPAEDRNTCLKNYHVRYLSGKSADLDKAKRRLTRMAFIGLAEEFGTSMQLLNWELGLDLELFTPVFNKNLYGKEKELSAKAKQVLLEMNADDIELYSFAKNEIFLPRMEAMKEFYGGGFPWNESAICDPNVVCWDKRMKYFNGTWGFNENPPPEAQLINPGLMKENILCGPKKGCKLVNKDKQDQSAQSKEKPLPPKLKFKSQSLCLASVFIVGARKGGTTSLYQYFSEHPNFKGILLDRGAQSGETFFFERKALPYVDVQQIPPDRLRAMYDRLFLNEFQRNGWNEPFDRQYFLTGESSVGMGPSCYTPRVLKETCGPQVKIIYLLRDPIDRMVSQYQMRSRLKLVAVESNFTASAQKHLRAIRTHPLFMELQKWLNSGQLLKTSPPCLFTNDFYNSIWSGLYIVHLARWFRQFDTKDIMIVQSEHFFKNSKQVFLDAMMFTQLDESLVDPEKITKQVFNAAPRAVKTQNAEEKLILQELRNFFKPFNQALSNMLQERNANFDLSLWDT
jgi:hypothetical protein